MIDLSRHAAEGHDPICPSADMENAWNGAECACALIRVLRSMDSVEHERTDFDTIWQGVKDEVAATEHDPFCPPGLKSAPPDRCTSCIIIRQGRADERLRILKSLYQLPKTDDAPWIHVNDVLSIVETEAIR
jgi:hypothetical protein